MSEIKAGSSGAPDGRGHRRGCGGECSPFQARAAFLQNWNWESVICINQGACARGQAQHGVGLEAGAACEKSWRLDHPGQHSLAEALELLRSYHRRAPFLFFNGNTFAAIAGQIAEAVFHDPPAMFRHRFSTLTDQGCISFHGACSLVCGGKSGLGQPWAHSGCACPVGSRRAPCLCFEGPVEL